MHLRDTQQVLDPRFCCGLVGEMEKTPVICLRLLMPCGQVSFVTTDRMLHTFIFMRQLSAGLADFKGSLRFPHRYEALAIYLPVTDFQLYRISSTPKAFFMKNISG
jgi:hypothetical protein